ncbi:MAG: SAM-dependent methyltransferase [Porticoccus sp.]|nr:MAG: SAM-dependent methyltransferase [Porticoccus sp.]
MDIAKNEFAPVNAEQVEEFINRWDQAGGSERANYQLFLTELCTVLRLPHPDPAGDTTEDNAYVFERRVDIKSPDGSISRGYIDLYKRGCFVIEAKQTGKALDSIGWDKAMLRAQNQADQYVRALPVKEGRPPFIVVTDVGRSLELYAEFSRSGGAYVPFPDPSHHRLRLTDLRDPDIQQRLHCLWHNPEQLDPSKHAARVTREVSAKLAELARRLEQQGYEVQRVAHFLKRCLFTMFSEDVGLLPGESFTQLLQQQQKNPEYFADSLSSLWDSMNRGGYSPLLNQKIRRFNGGLFNGVDPIPLDGDQISLLIDAAKADWRYVEPAIFGTLLERALDPRERHKLGAHYTPRAYVERLVMPTLIEPLRDQWQTVQVATEAWLQQGKTDKGMDELKQFHYQLCQIRVLDPACGSANFLYVALEHMKRLEGEVLNLISELSAGQVSFDIKGLTVDPHQFLGLELNPRAAAIAEIVLWIGYLQWHYRIHGKLDIPDPVLKDFRNIQHKDALLDYDACEVVHDDNGQPVTIWDGISYKKSSTTGELIPDEAGRLPVYNYTNPRKAIWPEADYIVGNPPFIGKLNMRSALGDGYVGALRQVYKSEVPESADLVMYWWHKAAEEVRKQEAERFGFITTNSLSQTFNRRVMETHLNEDQNPLMLLFVIPDHPWVDSANGAAVRIAMTVGKAGYGYGVLRQVLGENDGSEDAKEVTLNYREGTIFSDLTIGANVAGSSILSANKRLSTTGVIPHGSGMVLSSEQVSNLESSAPIKPYRNGKDLTGRSRNMFVIDCYGLSDDQVRIQYPKLYQWLLERVKPDRDVNRDKDLRNKWWLHRRNNEDMRSSLAELSRYIVTVMTSKHRVFLFLDRSVMPDQMLVNIAVDDSSILGVLSSRIHFLWALAAGGRLGVGNDSRYNKTRCFDTFPFPELEESQAGNIRQLAEQLDTLRKRQQEEYPELTLTGMYNVLEKQRLGELLNDKEKIIHQQGLVSILREIHDELDRAVFAAYGWGDLAKVLVGKPGATTPLPNNKPTEQAEAEEELLIRLVALNAQRVAEEAQGHIRWLRPQYQAPDASQSCVEFGLEEKPQATTVTAQGKEPWPKIMSEQVAVVRAVLAKGPQTVDMLASRFKRKPTKAILQVLAALEVLGHAKLQDDLWRL